MKNKVFILTSLLALTVSGGSLYVAHKTSQSKIVLAQELDKTKEQCKRLKVQNTQVTNEKDSLIKTKTNLENENKALNDKITSLEDKINNAPKETPEEQKQTIKQVSYEQPASDWNGQVLTPQAGTINGVSGKETYYNLPMDGVIAIMRGIGNNDPYWVREDGVKMLGDYVMVAADLSIRPRGSLIPTSLGMGIVCDTGSFIHSNPTQLDIAVAW